MLSNVCFVLAALVLYRLSRAVLRNDVLAERAALLFCINPASIFMSALYTESLFALLSFLGMWALEALGTSGLSLAALLFAASSAVRSNGAISCGFLLFTAASDFVPVADILLGKVGVRDWLRTVRFSPRGFVRLVASAAWAVMMCALVVLPILAVQLHGRRVWCSSEVLAVGSPHSAWCKEPLLFGVVPNFYGHIQAEYWNQGFLRYWQAKQLPNFVLYAPMFVLVARGTANFFVQSIGSRKQRKEDISNSNKQLVYVVHAALLAVFVLLCMHVQVGTRFLAASSPAVFWFAAEQASRSRVGTVLVCWYFVAYLLIGTLLFTNFYPWT